MELDQNDIEFIKAGKLNKDHLGKMIEARNKMMLTEHEEDGVSAAKLAKKYHLSLRVVQKILAETI